MTPTPIRLFFLLILMQAAHSMEEIAGRLYTWLPWVTGRAHETLTFAPRLSITPEAFITANIVIVLLMLVIGESMRRHKRWAWRIALAVGIIEMFNSGAHLVMAAVIGGYFPGSVSAVGLIIFGAWFLRGRRRAIREISNSIDS